ncbi:hypothetical protein N7468_009185 [Penicillium chermesinum]|uniref:Uncharacterized protein n=1 Tax=Penicillium chermesinum TaxID=63820 RepID=A0A9W9TEQ5_9EURO|nr:uncharacterized protein N7468_009185 [Penicillium chermesinum]KAJ5219981.1 hypothetical protein N7468_009185 [Penicillium chermesinum]KAJ6157438.1 hypothetical protein N7470_005030 [Penicillium chermesinum]
MALPLQELIPPPQEETPTAQEDTSPSQNETSLPQDEISLPHQEETSLSKEEASPPQEETLPRQHHAPIVSVAAKALAEKNIPVVEYGEQIQWRYGDPVLLLRVEWAVPDELLSLASEILSDQGFPPVSLSTEAVAHYGEWDRACTIHTLGGRCPVYLYPLSFVGLELQDTCKVTSTFDRTLKILTPKPNKYMVSLLRHLLNHPLDDIFRLRVKDDLLSFICFYILREKPLNTKDGECDDDENEEDYQNRVGEALREIETWDWGAGGKDYLSISESLVRDCRAIDQLTSC